MADNNKISIKLVADIQDVSKNVDQVSKKLSEVGSAGVDSSEKINRGYTSAAAGVRSISEQLNSIQSTIAKGAAVGAFVASIGSIVSSLNQAQQAGEKLKNSLDYSVGAANVAKELEYLRTTARNLGLDYQAAAEGYSKFSAAVKGSGMTLEQTRTVFEGVAQATAKFGLSADDAKGVFLALSQMASKGVVSAEEMRGQLAERLPGALRIAAQSMGVTEREFGKLMETGQIIASDFLPKFGQALKDGILAPLSSLTQEINRFTSAWEQWKQALANSDGSGFNWLTNGLNESAAAMRRLGNEAGIVQKLLVAIGGFEAGSIGVGHFDTAKVQQQAMDKLAIVSNGRRKMEGRNLNYLEQEQLRDLIRQEADLRSQLLQLAERRGKETFKLPDLAGEYNAQQAKRKTAFDGYMNEVQAEKEKELKKENDRFSALTGVIGTSGKDYETALAAHQAKIAEIRKKGAGADGSKNDAAQIFAAEIKAAQDSAKTAVDIIQEKIKQQVLAEREGVEQILAAQNEGYVKQAALLKDRLAGTTDAGERARLKTQIVELGNDAALAAEKAQAGIVKIDEANLKAFQSYMKGIGDETASLLDKAKASEMENEQIGMSAEALAELTRKRYDEQIALKQRRLDAIANNEGMAAEKHLIEEQIDALTRLRNAEIAKPKLREQAREWEKFSDDINRSLTDALMRGFESGKSFGQNFVDSLKNSLKTSALKIVVNYVTNGAGQLVGSVGNAAINGVLGTSSANGGSGTNYLGMASNVNSLYNVVDGTYLNTATGLYNDYVAGSTVMGYTAGYIGAGGSGITGSMFAGSNVLGTTSAGTLAGGGGSLGGGALGGGITSTGGTTGITGTVGGYGSALATETGGAAITTAAPASSSTGMGAYVWPLAAIVGMFMSSEAWKAGIKWNGDYSPGKNLKESGLHGAIHDGQYKSAEFFFGKDHADGQFFQTVTFAALSQQLSKMIWGDTKATGISSLKGAFVENGDGNSFVGQSGQEFRKAGGWFGSASTNVEWQNVGTDFQDGMSDLYKGVRNYLLLAGAAFDDYSLADKIKGFVTLVDVKNANNIQGVQEALANQIMQGLGSLMFPSIGAMQKTITKNGMAVAESWSEIFGRVMQEVAATGNIFELLGHNIFDIFGTGNADQVLRLSDNFVQLFENIEGMNQRVGAYYANFYSAQEKTDYAWKQMEQAFAGIQQVMPTTRQGFRDLVDAQIKLGPAGNEAFKALMDLQGAFAQLTPEISGLSKLTVAAAESMVKSAHALATVKASNTAFAQAQLNATITKADEAYAALERAVDAEKKKAQATADAAQEQVTDLRSIFDMLGNSIKSLYGSVPSVSNQSFSFIDDALATAQSSGYMPDATDLSNALSDAQNVLSQRVYASEVDQQRDRLVLAGKLSQLKEIGGDQLDSAKQSLETAKAELDRLDNVLLTAKTQLDELKGINVSVLSVTAALADLALIMQQAFTEKEQVTSIKKMTDPNSIAITAAYQSALGRSPEKAGLDYWAKLAAEKGVGFAVNGINTSAEAQVSALYSSVLGRAPDAGGLAHWMDKLNNGMSYEAAKAAMQTSDEYVASHPVYASAASAPAASTESSISNLYATLLGRTADDGGLANWASQVTGAGWSIDQVAEAIKASDEYKSNHHATGLEYVPFDGYKATLHQGEAVVDAQSVSAIRRYFNVAPANGGGNEQLITFINKLMLEVQELKTLQSENNRYARRTANATNGNPDVPVLVKVV